MSNDLTMNSIYEDSGPLEITLVASLKHGMLRRWLKDRKWTARMLAKAIGCSDLTIGYWLSLRARPSKKYHAKLEEITGYPITQLFPDWFKPSMLKGLTQKEETQSFSESDIKLLQLEAKVNAPLLLEEKYELEELKDIVWDTLDGLLPRERDILKMRFGLFGDEPLGLEEIGLNFSISRERVRQVLTRALEKLKDLAKDVT